MLNADLSPNPSPTRRPLANSENLTPQPPSLVGKGEPESPSPLRGGVGEGSDPSVNSPTVSYKERGIIPIGLKNDTNCEGVR
jgi:hypothetical protein